MPDQLTDRARKAAEEVRNFLISDASPAHGDFISGVAAIFVRHMLSERAEILEQALSEAYAKLDEVKSILGKVL